MKRSAALLLILILAASLCAPALAAQYQDANWMYADWELNGYPDDVGGVYSYDGDATHLCVLLVDRTPEREEEIRTSLEDSETLRFGDATHSYADVLAVRDEIEASYAGSEQFGVVGIGVTVNDAKSDFVVSVDVTADRYEETSALLSEKYGDAVKVICSETAEQLADVSTGEDQAQTGSKDNKGTIIYMVVYLGLFLAVCVFLFLRRKKRSEERK
ncbi:MAG: hypothetical protein J5569_07920 [Oscillospiraceae bacterium]|nr:hypothetical protein [Oscillospiraceae bacterium]